MARGIKKIKQLKNMPTDQLMDEISRRKAEIKQHEHNISRIKKELKEARKNLLNTKLRFDNAFRWLKIRYNEMV